MAERDRAYGAAARPAVDALGEGAARARRAMGLARPGDRCRGFGGGSARLGAPAPWHVGLAQRPVRARREPDVPWGWRALAIAVAALEAALLVWLWFGPALAISSVQVTGAHHLTSSQVAQDAGLSGDTSVISVDVVTAHDRLMKQVWLRSVDVQPQLLGTVVIQVSEWEPVAAYHAGTSTKLYFMSSQAVVLGATSTAAGLVDVQGPAGHEARAGDRPPDPQPLN